MSWKKANARRGWFTKPKGSGLSYRERAQAKSRWKGKGSMRKTRYGRNRL